MEKKIITISREFGSGGRELGKRISDVLGCDYYDSEIIAAVAKQSGLDAAYVATALGEHGWKQYPITFRNTLGSASYLQSSKVNLLLQQRRVLEEIAKLGKDCVIVGRNADTILREYEPFRVFVCADMETKLRRCRERAPEGENLTDKELMRQICDAGGAIFFSTHVLEVAEKLCDKVAIIKGGKLIKSGTMEEVKGYTSLEDVFLELEDEQ